MRPRTTIEPMLAKAVDRLPEGPVGSLLYEPKMDGFRCIASADVDRGVHLRSRRGARLNETFPEIMWAVHDHLPLPSSTARSSAGARRAGSTSRRCSAVPWRPAATSR
jgi:ATP-dependent DNA ligase